ncbi:hypothetical protein ElyMa_001570300 [Elysia marginata]|uniref:Uncharacterized protein n=1 Tax=Elysia marginata TaxID=1093978 RepID=A0AAV4JC95_9GAST|nr:hypothetical protein ElyMa_001570300 [Elysia marginata]
MAGGGNERYTRDHMDGTIELKFASSSNENSEDKEMEQRETLDSANKCSDCPFRMEKPKHLGIGVDRNKQSHDGSQDVEVGFDGVKRCLRIRWIGIRLM